MEAMTDTQRLYAAQLGLKEPELLDFPEVRAIYENGREGGKSIPFWMEEGRKKGIIGAAAAYKYTFFPMWKRSGGDERVFDMLARAYEKGFNESFTEWFYSRNNKKNERIENEK